MAFLNDLVFDEGLSYLTTNADRVDITSTEATTYAEATSTLTLGNGTASVGSPANRTGGGREVTVAAVTAGNITGTGTAAFYAITDGTNLLATGSLSASQSVTSGNSFTLEAFTIGIPDPA